MTIRPELRIIELFAIEPPILFAPMTGPSMAELAIAVSGAGGRGAFACALSTPDQTSPALGRPRASDPVNMNVFTHMRRNVSLL
jgi:nitronate monooxygenase